MTPQEFVTYVRDVHNADDDSHWSDQEILNLYTQVANDVLSIIGLIQAVTTTASVASQQTYAYPDNAVFIRRIRYNNEPLQLLTFRQQESDLRSDTLRTGKPRGFILWNELIYLQPVPDTDGDTIQIFYEKEEPTAIDVDSGSLATPSVLHGRIADGVIQMMYAKDENWTAFDRFEQRWNQRHLPAFHEYRSQRKARSSAFVTTDVDSVLSRDYGTP